MPNYQNGMIYEIRPYNCESIHERYIGSTTKVSPVERFLIHKKNTTMTKMVQIVI